MPSDRDAHLPKGWNKCLHLPQFMTCHECGAVCDQQSAVLHTEWHGRQP